MTCRTICIAIAIGAGTVRLQAQQPPPAPETTNAATSGFIGVVVDSIHGGPLSGAIISVVGTGRHATADGNGRFRIDSLPAGAYQLALTHALFDTLGLKPLTQPINLAPHRFAVVALGTPSARTLRHQFCPNVDTLATPSLIMGQVRDADTGLPAAGAHVSVDYSRTAVTLASGVSNEIRVRRATADADGTYAICGLERDVRGTVQAEHDGMTTAAVATSIEGKVVALRSLSTGSAMAGALTSVDSGSPATSSGIVRRRESPAPELQRGIAKLTGFVRDSSGSPLAGAFVAVTATADSARTGSRGEFAFADLPSGTQELRVRTVGFEPATLPIELTTRETRSLVVRLRRAPPSLAPVVVRSTTDESLARLGFFDRQKASAGFFITPEQVAKAQPRVVTDLIFLVPGWQVQHTSAGLTVLLPPRSAFAEGASACLNVYVDHALMTRLAPGEFDSAVPPRDIVAMEVYLRSTVPAEFARAGESCVTIVVWTRARVEKE